MRRRRESWWRKSIAAIVAVLALAGGSVAAAAVAPQAEPRVAPVVEAEFLISATGATADEEDVQVAWSGTEYLVVWQDARQQATRGADIYGRRVGADGTLLGEEFRISGPDAVDNEEDPAVAWGGTEYVVVWSDDRRLPDRSSDIYGQRVSAAGAPVGAEFRVSGPGAVQWEETPALVRGGTGYLAVWEDGRNHEDRGSDVYGHLLTAAGVPTGSDFRISGTNATFDEAQPSVAWSGTDFLVAWEDWRNFPDRGWDVRGRRVTAAGEPAGKDFRISGTNATASDRSPAVAWSGTDYLVVWEDWRNLAAQQSDVYGRRVSAAGVPLGANFCVTGPESSGWAFSPALAWDETAGLYLVVWQDERDYGTRGSDIYGRRVAADGSRVGGDFRISGPAATAYEYSPAVASGGTEDLAIWQDARDAVTHGRDVYGRRVAP